MRFRIKEFLLMILLVLCLYPQLILGQITFSKYYGTERMEWSNSIVQTIDNGYIICGNQWETEYWDPSDIYVLKTDKYVEMEWFKPIGEDSTDESSWDIIEAYGGGYILTGRWRGPPAKPDSETYLLKLDDQGDVEWLKIYKGCTPNSVVKTIDGGYMIGVILIEQMVIYQ